MSISWGLSGNNSSLGGDERGQMGPLGLTLVFGFALVGSVLIVAFALSAVGGSQDTLNDDRAEKALTQFDSKAALVALGNTDTQSVSFPSGTNDYEVVEGEGWMRVTVDNRSDSDGEKTLFNQTMGSIVYETEDGKLAYQGGGVWRSTSNNSQMVSPPEFHFRNGTLTLPAVNITGDRSLGDEATISHEETIGNVSRFPDGEFNRSNFTNPLTNHRVKLVVKSEYYKGWGEYFEERTDGEVTYNHDRNIANLTLVTPIQQTRIKSASASLAASGTFTVSGNPYNGCHGSPFTDSYNSSVDSYCAGPSFPNENGDLVYGEGIDISGGGGSSDFYGDVISGGDVTTGNNIDVHGDINFTTSCTACNNSVQGSGTVNKIDGVSEAPAINFFVQEKVSDLESDNHNDGRIDSGELELGENSPTDEVTLDSGRYYLEEIDIGSGERIVFDTTSGDVTLAVEEEIDLNDGSNVDVVGDGKVRIYVEGVDTGGDPQLNLGKDVQVSAPDDDATQLRVYGQDNFTADIGGGAIAGDITEFTGVIYAPPGDDGTGSVTLRKAQVFGGILTGDTTIDDRGVIHYDEALQNEDVVSPGAKVVKVTYLHVSINKINVEGS